jgi:hypothetical protein
MAAALPALIALLLSMAFTLFAQQCPQAAGVVAAPVAIVAIALMAWQSHKIRRDT